MDDIKVVFSNAFCSIVALDDEDIRKVGEKFLTGEEISKDRATLQKRLRSKAREFYKKDQQRLREMDAMLDELEKDGLSRTNE